MRIPVLTALILLGLFRQSAFADVSLAFGPAISNIKGSIKYSVVGRYNAVFEKYEGRLTVDQDSRLIKSVTLDIAADSIQSKHPSFDKIVRSPQLLNVGKFPSIIFQSKSITKNGDSYTVVGDLTLHGITREIASPFSAVVGDDGTMTIKGEWLIKRKEFGIIWNRLLDKGGILVGDIITVNWEIKIPEGELQ